MKLYQVGGCNRDKLLGIDSKDIDFAVEGVTFDELREYLSTEGFDIFVETPEYLTIRCRIPEDHALRRLAKDADFTLCRSDGDYSDGRHPDSVSAACIFTDLARRDFTMNAIAVDAYTGEIIDPHYGQQDIAGRVIKAVGNPAERLEEDPLRALRALRFSYTRDMRLDPYLAFAIKSGPVTKGLASLPPERIYEEMKSIFRENASERLDRFMVDTTKAMRDVMFSDMHLLPSMAEV